MPEGDNKDIAQKCHEMAKRYYEEGLAVIPVKYRDKRPLIPWKEYQEKRPAWEEIEGYFLKGANVGILCGVPSGGLVVFDFDERELYLKFKAKYPDINTRTVRTRKGVHVYFRVNPPPDTTRIGGKIDVQSQGTLVVAPPSIHPSGVRYEFENDAPIQEITTEEYKQFIQTLKEMIAPPRKEEKTANIIIEPGEGRKLTQHEINQIVELLKKYYIRGFRDYIVLYLTGWLYKSNIAYESAEKIIMALAEEDEEKQHRLLVLRRTYHDLPPERSPEDIKGKAGLQETLEQVNETKGITSEEAREMALYVIRNLQGIIGRPSPFRDSIVYEHDAETKIYAVADPIRKEIYQARYNTKEKRLIRKREVIEAVPVEVIGIYDPFNESTIKYIVVMEDKTGNRRRYGPASLPDIVGALWSNGLVKNRNLANDYLSGIIRQYLLAGKGEIKNQTTVPGFFIHNGEMVNNVLPEEVEPQKLKEALEFLDKIIRREFKNPGVRRKIAMVIKWSIMAPFSFIRKQLYPEKRQPWVYLRGPTNTGKTTIGMIGCYIWWDAPSTAFIIPFAKVNTEARLGEILSKTTLPYIFDEADLRPFQRKTTYLDTLKNAISGIYVRGRIERMIYTEIPAFAPVIFTSNHSLPHDEALLKRLLVITFDRQEIIPDGPTKKRFIRQIVPQLPKLNAIGIAAYLIIKSEYKERGERIFQEDWEKQAEKVLKMLYKAIGLDPPDWIWYHYEEEIETEEDLAEELRAWFIEEINRAYRNMDYSEKHIDLEAIRGITDSTEFYDYVYESFKQKVIKVLSGNYVPWGQLRESDEGQQVILFRSMVSRLPYRIREGIQDNFKTIMEILEGEGITAIYKQVKIRGKVKRAIVVPIESFVSFLQRSTPEAKQQKLSEVI